MIRRPPRSTRTDTSFPTRRSSDLAVALDQPRAIALSAEAMHIATAGDNRIWTYNLGKRELRLLAGSGALGVSDGSGNRASFAQPVGLATVQQMLYACDAAGSAIRRDRKSVVEGKSVAGRVDFGGPRIIKKKNQKVP